MYRTHPPCRVLMLIALVAATTTFTGCTGSGLLITPVSTNQELRETLLSRDSFFARDRIAVIDVSGIIMNDRKQQLLGGGEHPVSLLLEQLDKARRDSRVKAVILRINSPGGTVVASELMHDEISHFRKTTGKPVIAVLMDIAASGGYYIACACDEIIAQRSTVTGSIGVIMQMFELSGTLRKIGVTTDAIISGQRKDSGSPFRPMTSAEREMFQEIVDQMHERFVQVVAAGRKNLDVAAVRKLADGRIYLAAQALELGLIDRIATMRDAVAEAKARVGATSVRVVAYRRPTGYRPNYYANMPWGRPPEINLLKLDLGEWLDSTAPRFLYLWRPGGF